MLQIGATHETGGGIVDRVTDHSVLEVLQTTLLSLSPSLLKVLRVGERGTGTYYGGMGVVTITTDTEGVGESQGEVTLVDLESSLD